MKIPRSVLVVIYCTDAPSGFWQSVTGSVDFEGEPLSVTCQREVQEETGVVRNVEDFQNLAITNTYEIYPAWRTRYAVGVTTNTETVFALKVPYATAVVLNPSEHTRHQWLPLEAAAMQCFSLTNTKAIQAVQANELSQGDKS
jgi:dihydroneopterin triphosphate diphosphatase